MQRDEDYPGNYVYVKPPRNEYFAKQRVIQKLKKKWIPTSDKLESIRLSLESSDSDPFIDFNERRRFMEGIFPENYEWVSYSTKEGTCMVLLYLAIIDNNNGRVGIIHASNSGIHPSEFIHDAIITVFNFERLNMKIKISLPLGSEKTFADPTYYTINRSDSGIIVSYPPTYKFGHLSIFCGDQNNSLGSYSGLYRLYCADNYKHYNKIKASETLLIDFINLVNEIINDECEKLIIEIFGDSFNGSDTFYPVIPFKNHHLTQPELLSLLSHCHFKMLVIGYDAGNTETLIPIERYDFLATGCSTSHKIYAFKGFLCYTGASVGQNAASIAMTVHLHRVLSRYDGDWIKSLKDVTSSAEFKQYGVTPYWETYPNPQ